MKHTRINRTFISTRFAPPAKALLALALAASALTMPSAQARDTLLRMSFADLLASPEAEGKLGTSVRFYLAGAATPKVVTRHGEDTSRKKTNGFNKTAATGCQWAALSALVAFEAKARKMGANAVINIVSIGDGGVESSSATEYECHDGAFVNGVSLKGTYATVEK